MFMLKACAFGYNREYGVSIKIMILFFQAVLENVLRYRIHFWYGNLTVRLKCTHLIQMAMKIMGKREYSRLQTLYEKINAKRGMQDFKLYNTHFES